MSSCFEPSHGGKDSIYVFKTLLNFPSEFRPSSFWEAEENIHLLRNLENRTFIYHSFYFITGVKPLKLIIMLKGELKAAFPSVPGIYIRGPNSKYQNWWFQDPGTSAIWYDFDYGGWNIGSQDDLGTSKTWFYALDGAGPEIAKTWEYDDGRPIKSDDIVIELRPKFKILKNHSKDNSKFMDNQSNLIIGILYCK